MPWEAREWAVREHALEVQALQQCRLRPWEHWEVHQPEVQRRNLSELREVWERALPVIRQPAEESVSRYDAIFASVSGEPVFSPASQRDTHD